VIYIPHSCLRVKHFVFGDLRPGKLNCLCGVGGILASSAVSRTRVPRITAQDMEGVAHTAEVTAATLYEAVALGIAAIRGDAWVTDIAQGMNTVRVRVTSVAVEHEVRLMDFTKWLDKDGGSPREVTDRNRIRTILGMEKSGRGR
jgi:hypothetical protein